MSEYRPRFADIELERSLKAFGSVLIEGPRGCGKTTVAEQFSKSALYLQDKEHCSEYQEMLKVKPSLLLKGNKPRLIDEWQMGTQLWDAIRYDVDKNGEYGSYILTGSAKTNESKISHSGAGRIKRMRMSTMSLFESDDSNGSVSLSDLFDNHDIEGLSKLSIEDVSELIVRGGYPQIISANPKNSTKLIKEHYKTLLESDIITIDGVKRNKERMKKILRSVSRNISTSVSDSVICSDLKENENISVHINTVRDYQNALKKLFVIQNLPAWSPSLRSKATVRTSDVRHFCDPAIATYFLGASPKNLLEDLETFGLLFESLVIRDLRVYAKVYGGEVYHYHDSNDLEVDAIVHLRDGRWGAIEVKLGSGMIESATKNLMKLKDIVDNKKMGEPSFLAVVTGTEYAYRREDGVYVVPIGCLKP